MLKASISSTNSHGMFPSTGRAYPESFFLPTNLLVCTANQAAYEYVAENGILVPLRGGEREIGPKKGIQRARQTVLSINQSINQSIPRKYGTRNPRMPDPPLPRCRIVQRLLEGLWQVDRDVFALLLLRLPFPFFRHHGIQHPNLLHRRPDLVLSPTENRQTETRVRGLAGAENR